ncbi:RNA polymerase sigma-70 factor [Chitinophaga sp. sic0106]|uniref:RNA polymerase sigma-70 factor n=1 Tax=Chitinophaga sp. sic0106 TaxID=2854785 RepID=UPI001C4394F0|nr:RNA polymerase sigma-70 factor [Chitinophaga sp. sic0106]MBV7529450.1 RNA polymerase sigma-70 factor [Chitinophaga sp. sic0106]
MLTDCYTDHELLGLLQTSDHRAFNEIYRRYWDKLYYLAAKKLQELEEAESIVQDVFVDLWHRREQLRIHENLEGYLVVAVKYRIINYLARQDRFRSYQQYISTRQNINDSTTEDWISFEDLREWLFKMVAQLPEKCRMAYQLREEGFTQKEIAQQMQISEKTVETHISRALKAIRASISQRLSSLFSLLF